MVKWKIVYTKRAQEDALKIKKSAEVYALLAIANIKKENYIMENIIYTLSKS